MIVLGRGRALGAGNALRGHDRAGAGETDLLPLLLFPLMVPALLASVKATSLLILGDPMGQVRRGRLLLVAFDADLLVALRSALRPRGRG